VRLEVIGVQLDQARNDEVARDILRADGRTVGPEVRDHAVCDRDPARLDHPVLEHQAGIGENERLAVWLHGSGCR
jgi:hypothetical protein